MHRFLREPLLHFFLLGAVLFGLYFWLQGGSAKAPDEIVVTRGQQQSLQAQFQRTRQRPPTADELRALVDSWVREEIFYREGLAMGLDRDDPVVRRRVGQKVEFIAEGTTPNPPTTAELQAWLDAHPEKYTVEARYTLRQVIFDPARRGAGLEADIAAARQALTAGRPATGDSTMLPPALTDASASEVRRVFGQDFVEALNALNIGAWEGPIRSGFGLHLVRLDTREAGHKATVEEARTIVERDLSHARSLEAKAAHYRRLRENYSVRIEDPPSVVAAK